MSVAHGALWHPHGRGKVRAALKSAAAPSRLQKGVQIGSPLHVHSSPQSMCELGSPRLRCGQHRGLLCISVCECS